MTDVTPWLEPGESIHWQGAPAEHLHRYLGADLRYIITDRRVLIADETGMDSYTPAMLAKLDLRPADDGTADVVWDSAERVHHTPHRAGLTLRFRSVRRDDRIGFIGVPDGPAALQQLERWLAARHDAAATEADAAWRTHREPTTGFTMQLPASWQVRVGMLKEFKILGIRIQRPPQWTDRADAAWNTLEATVPGTAMAVVVSLNPAEMPTSLDEVVNSRLAAMLSVKTLSSDANVRIGTLEGFSVLQDLHGAVGGRLQLGPVTVSAAGFKDKLLQRQIWLRDGTHSVHIVAITPADADALRSVADRVIASMRFGDLAKSVHKAQY